MEVIVLVERIGVSYYHAKAPAHAAKDFQAIAKTGMNTIVLAVSEDDCSHWFPNMIHIVEEAKKAGLFVYWNFWGWGHIFGGEPSSRFLDQHISHRQVTSSSNIPVAAACFNDPAFSEYFLGWVRRVVHEVPVDGIFIDEPHYWYNFAETSWTCHCPNCQAIFQEKFGKMLPTTMTEEVLDFREAQLLKFTQTILETVRDADDSKQTAVVLLPFDDDTPIAKQSGALRNWEALAKLPHLDVLGTDPYCHIFHKPISWAEKIAKKTIEVTRKYRKKSQLWVQLFALPKGKEEEVAELIHYFANIGVDEILAWTYLAAKGTTIACAYPDNAWKTVLKAFQSI
jgi:hypothetical protein